VERYLAERHALASRGFVQCAVYCDINVVAKPITHYYILNYTSDGGNRFNVFRI